MKREDIPKGALVTYKNFNDAKAHALVKFLKYLYDTEQVELAEKLQEYVKEAKKNFMEENNGIYKLFWKDEVITAQCYPYSNMWWNSRLV